MAIFRWKRHSRRDDQPVCFLVYAKGAEPESDEPLIRVTETEQEIYEVGYPFDCHVLGSVHSRLAAARHGRSWAGWARLPGWERGPVRPGGLIALGLGFATNCR